MGTSNLETKLLSRIFSLLVILLQVNAAETTSHEKYLRGEPLGNRTLSTVTSARKLKSGNLPKIFIVGVQKGGSSSLFELMIQHPLLCGGTHKESHFFDKLDNYNKGTDYYKSLYVDKKCSKNTESRYIDGTPMIHYTNVWERIYNTYQGVPDVRDNLKFIVLLREPVSRDYSWYQHAVRTDLRVGLKFSDVKTIQELYKGSSSDHRKGRYLEQLEAFVKYFRRNQILIISSVAIFQNTQEIVEKIRAFIDVPRDESFTKPLPHDAHLGRIEKEGLAECVIDHIPQLDCSVRDRMGAYYEPLNLKLYEWIEATKGDADPNEPAFWPLFDSYNALSCVNDSRAVFNKVLEKDKKEKRSACVNNPKLDEMDLYNPF
jgi:Sulfotransferase domain